MSGHPGDDSLIRLVQDFGKFYFNITISHPSEVTNPLRMHNYHL